MGMFELVFGWMAHGEMEIWIYLYGGYWVYGFPVIEFVHGWGGALCMLH